MQPRDGEAESVAAQLQPKADELYWKALPLAARMQPRNGEARSVTAQLQPKADALMTPLPCPVTARMQPKQEHILQQRC